MSRGRIAGLVALVAGVGAVALTLAAVRAGGGAAPAVVSVETAVASAVPPTVAPRSATSPAVEAPPAESPGAPDGALATPVPGPGPGTTGAPGTAPISPLASLLPPRDSARPVPVEVGPAPVALSIEPLGVAAAPIDQVGVDDEGALEIPPAERVGWYRLGSGPGRAGATVLTAHINFDGRPGVFARLGAIEPGAAVVVELDDASTRTYEVVERTSYAKDALPAERVWATDGDEVLVLITCGGAYDPAARRYADNIVAYAVPVA